MRKFKEIHIETVAIDDLDMDFPFFEPGEDEVRNDVETYRGALSESPAIGIDRLITLLSHMKEKGATHVYIGDHCDHHGYEFDAVKLEEQDGNT